MVNNVFFTDCVKIKQKGVKEKKSRPDRLCKVCKAPVIQRVTGVLLLFTLDRVA